MRLFHQLIACYLALSLAFAGAVGTSPVLHQIFEHGGDGPAHTHLGLALSNPGDHHEHDGVLHQHTHDLNITKAKARRAFAHDHEFDLPRIDVQRIWHLLSHLLEGDSSEHLPDASGKVPRHHHDSLPQLIAGGLLDQHVEPPGIEQVLSLLHSPSLLAGTFNLVPGWDPQTASRAPPPFRSG